jgi:hypothetical protein
VVYFFQPPRNQLRFSGIAKFGGAVSGMCAGGRGLGGFGVGGV